MSWWVYMVDKDEQTLTCEPFEDGGTYPLGGTSECELNVTYNYGGHFYKALGFEFKALDGMTGDQSILALAKAVDVLGTIRDDDYWASTPGNAGAVLARMLAWARAYPDGKFLVH